MVKTKIKNRYKNKIVSLIVPINGSEWVKTKHKTKKEAFAAAKELSKIYDPNLYKIETYRIRIETTETTHVL